MLFDTHAHYDDEAFDADRDAVLTALPQRGVGLILNPGCDVESSRKAVTYAAAYPHVYAAVGIHPENCGGFTADDLAAIRALAQQPKVVAIGEIGLDYYWEENPPRDFQQQVLRQQNRQRRIQCQQSAALLTEFIVHFPDVVFRLHTIKLRSHRHHLPVSPNRKDSPPPARTAAAVPALPPRRPIHVRLCPASQTRRQAALPARPAV